MSLLAVAIDSTNSAAVGSANTGVVVIRIGARHRRRRERTSDVVEALADAVDRDLAGDLAGLVTAHAVGDDERGRRDEQVVLVLGPDAARVGRRSDAQLSHRPTPLREFGDGCGR